MNGPLLRSLLEAHGQGRVIGVEREYDVLAGSLPIDVRPLWPRLPQPGASIDPGDLNARRIPSGVVITVDGRQAEVATPPVKLRPGCTEEVLALAAAGRGHLLSQFAGCEFAGYSTHINVEVDDDQVATIARLVAGRLALPIMLVLDRRESPGLLVRPRPGRLEVGGEFVAGDQLRAAVVMTVGMVLLAQRCAGLRRPLLRSVPPARCVPAVERFGWFVDRTAFGPDLYQQGRAMELGRVRAGDLLVRLWNMARPLLEDTFDLSELATVDGVVDGRAPLPLEDPQDDDGQTATPAEHGGYETRRRDGYQLRVVQATWWRALLELQIDDRRQWLTVPGRALDALLTAVDAGSLDAELVRLGTGSDLEKSRRFLASR